ncbi:ABC transporter substrate-binding protein [Bengtsoniella intestinalis]|uniref:ABC transporter substrate-binding protein n=1 Tax=Bengtsoniella intestinalis TaxID=3073143 RepID=UPI00391F83B2
MKKRILAVLMAATLIGTVLSACGDSSQETPETTTTPKADTTSLVVGISQDLDSSLDPHKTVSAGTREVMFNVFEGLVKPTATGDMSCAVAQDYTIDDSATVYTFTLRDGITFHNGQAVTVDDVVYSLTRCIDPEEAGINALSGVASVEATDDATVVVILTQPSNEFLAYLTVAIIPADYTEQDTAPVGTGPFAFDSRTAQESVVLSRYDGYWGDVAEIETVELQVFENADALVLSLQSGAVDMSMHLTATQAAQLGDDYTVTEGTMNLVQALYINNAVEPLNNELVRQAMSYAINRQEILDFTSDGLGTIVGSSMYPAFEKYYDADLADYYDYDVEKAKDLLSQAGYADGFDLTITVPSNYTPHMDAALVMVEQLKLIGITATIEPVEWATWVEDVYVGRNYETTVIGVDASSLTASAMLSRFVSTADNNFINYDNAEYDALYQKAQDSRDDAEQVQIFKQMQLELTQTAANVYIQDMADLVVHRTDLDGFQFYPLYALDLSGLYFTN